MQLFSLRLSIALVVLTCSVIWGISRQSQSFTLPSTSSKFLPMRTVPANKEDIEKFKAIASTLPRDSTHHWTFQNGKISISHDLLMVFDSVIAMKRRAGKKPSIGLGKVSSNTNVTGNFDVTGSVGNTIYNPGENLLQFLSTEHGLNFSNPGNGFANFRPNDPNYLNVPQWALHNSGATIAERPGKVGIDINIERVWDKFSGSDSLLIAVVDAGFNFKHPDLQAKNWINQVEAKGKPGIDDDQNGFIDDSLGWDFVEGDNNPQDFHGHGTYCASIIAANFDNKEGLAGIVPNCKIMPVRVLDASGHGSQADIASGIYYAVNNGAKVINFSIGGEGDNTAMRTAFQYARDKGVPIIVAAGNEGNNIDSALSYPAAYPFENIIVAAAHDHAGLLCGFSNYGKTMADLAAPGELVIVAGIPESKQVFREDFEATTLNKWTLSSGFALSTTSPMESKQSLVWTAGSKVTATMTDYLDLSAKDGCVVKFLLEYKPGNFTDVLILEAQIQGSTIWTEIGVIGAVVDSGTVLDFGMQGFDKSMVKLRFRTSSSNGFSISARKIKIDELTIVAADPNPPSQGIYPMIAGTSIAAPHITAYVGLQRLACDRMGLPWTKALALQGVITEPTLTGKVATGGRLDVYKGLEFYLSTLPNFQFMDSTALTWHVGDTARYSLALVPVPTATYKYAVSGLDSNATIDGAGQLNWIPTVSQVGAHRVTFTAFGANIFRNQFELKVLASESKPQTVFVSDPVISSSRSLEWRIAGSTFRLPPTVNTGRHLVTITGVNLLGQKRLIKKDWMCASDFKQPVQFLPLGVSISQIQVFVDGILLAQIAG